MKKFIESFSAKLEECPFCKKHNLEHAIYSSGGCIECSDCGCIGPESFPDYDIDKAVSIWNDRGGKHNGEQRAT